MRKILFSLCICFLLAATLSASVEYHPSIQASGGFSQTMLKGNLRDGNHYWNPREKLTADIITLTLDQTEKALSFSLPITLSMMNPGSVVNNLTLEPRLSLFLSFEVEGTYFDFSEALFAGAGFTRYNHLKSYNLIFQIGERSTWMFTDKFGLIVPLTFEFTKNDWNVEAGIGIVWRIAS